jgi:hypothetical protein
MAQRDTAIQVLSDSLIREIINAVGLPQTAFTHNAFSLFFHKATERLAAIGVTADRMIASEGFPVACAWMMHHWVSAVTVQRRETVPPQGPLLVISNHCGAYDFLVISSQLNRADLTIISSDIPFLKGLPTACIHLIFVSDDLGSRMTAARAGVRHLQGGGALLLYGTGLIDPDPAVYPGAENWIEKWLPSINLFLRTAPDTQVVLSIASGMVAERWAYHPITWFRHVDWQKRRLAEFGQVIQQLIFPGSLYLQPCISFLSPISVEELRRETQSDHLLPVVIARAKALLASHIAWRKSLTKIAIQNEDVRKTFSL